MAKFLTRVELHGADDDDYSALHGAMAERGFSRTLVYDGKRYKLPTAEYVCVTDLTVGEVRDSAIAAAQTTGRKYWVLTVEYIRSAWKLAVEP